MSPKFYTYMIYSVFGCVILLLGLIVADIVGGFSSSWKETPVLLVTKEKEILEDEEQKVPELMLPSTPIIISDAPFTSQAPFGNWDNSIYQEGCEEASLLMAVYWARGEVLTSEKANLEIKNIADFELKTFGAYLDTSLHDTAKIMEEYFSFNHYRVKENIAKSDIIQSLSHGSIVLVPTFGRDLKNPNYTPPGPVEHMVVITGYDPEKNEFITNDPGTRNGEGYVYNEDVLFEALWSYPTSSIKLAPPGPDEKRLKGMIEVSRS